MNLTISAKRFGMVTLTSALLVVGCSSSGTTEETPQTSEKAATTAPKSPSAAPAPTGEAAAPTAVKNGFDGMPAPGTTAFCPVMKHDFEVQADSSFAVYEGKTYVFCCPGCKPKFEADPKKYIAEL